jgi:hypothetical protein
MVCPPAIQPEDRLRQARSTQEKGGGYDFERFWYVAYTSGVRSAVHHAT